MLDFLRVNAVTALLAAGLGAAMIFPMDPPEPSQPSHAQIAGKPDLVVGDASKQLKHTHVTAYLTREHAPGTSLLWCSTFQMAWDQFSKVGGPLTLEGNPPMAVQLSAHPFPMHALDDDSFVAMIGKGPETIDRITAELDRKFKGAASPSVLPSKGEISKEDLVAYAYLFKNLAFEMPLTKAPRGMTFGPSDAKPKMYRAFGIFNDTKDWGKVASQVTIWHSGAPDDFVIELRTKEKQDRLIIARLKPGATLKETADRALGRTKAPSAEPALRDDEKVMIPVLNFDITRSFDEVTNIPSTTKSSPVAYIRSAKQNIRFRLDEMGAVLKSDASIVAPTSIAPGKRTPPRQFICDGPFLVLMQRQGAGVPYFAAWIDNPELLVTQK